MNGLRPREWAERSFPRPGCPIHGDRDRVVSAGRSLVQALRRLRRDLRQCAACSARPDCPALAGFHAQVQAALEAVQDEWDLRIC